MFDFDYSLARITLKIEVSWAVTVYQLIWRNIAEDLNVLQHGCENVKSRGEFLLGEGGQKMKNN
jgi:hypothetical protein